MTREFAVFASTASGSKKGKVHRADCHYVLDQVAKVERGEWYGGDMPPPYSVYERPPLFLSRAEVVTDGLGEYERCAVCAPDLPRVRRRVRPRSVQAPCPWCLADVWLHQDGRLTVHEVMIVRPVTTLGRALPVAELSAKCPGSRATPPPEHDSWFEDCACGPLRGDDGALRHRVIGEPQ